jgi:VWFA-related protein
VSARTLLAALACLGIAQTPVPIFKTGVEAVRVDVLVTRDGRPLPNLTPADFEVLDNGVPQRLDYASFEEIPLNLVFALDASSSVEGDRALRLRRACHGVLAELKKDDQAGLVVFSDPLVVRSGLTRDLAAVRIAVDRPLRSGDTSLVDAVHASILVAESEPGRALVIVFSDGIEVSSYLPADTVLDTARRSDAVVYGVSLRRVPGPPFLRDLAEASGGDFFEIASPADIEPTFRRVLEEFRHRYLLSYTPAGVDRAGWHRLQVRVKQRGVSVRARPGYFRQE